MTDETGTETGTGTETEVETETETEMPTTEMLDKLETVLLGVSDADIDAGIGNNIDTDMTNILEENVDVEVLHPHMLKPREELEADRQRYQELAENTISQIEEWIGANGYKPCASDAVWRLVEIGHEAIHNLQATNRALAASDRQLIKQIENL